MTSNHIVFRTIEHIEGEIQLPMPNIPMLSDDTHTRVEFMEPELVVQLEEAVAMWQTHIDATIAACLGKVIYVALDSSTFKV